MGTTIADQQLEAFAERVRGKTVLITGAGSGIGRESAVRFAKFGAKIVVADLNEAGAAETVQEIVKAGGEAIAHRCDVTSWEDQSATFDAAVEKFKSVDVVVANAGISETGTFLQPTVVDGKVVKPSLKTVDVNLTGVLYTAHLALHYLQIGREGPDTSLKALVLMSSIAAFQPPPGGPLYSASKSAIRGFLTAADKPLAKVGITIATIHPWFSDTGILSAPLRRVLTGLPLVPVERIAGAVLYAATEPDIQLSGSAYVMLDGGEVVRLPSHTLANEDGVYKALGERLQKVYGFNK